MSDSALWPPVSEKAHYNQSVTTLSSLWLLLPATKNTTTNTITDLPLTATANTRVTDFKTALLGATTCNQKNNIG